MTQGLLQLPTTGTVSGLQNNQDANAALAALAGMVQGGAAPTPASTGLAATAGLLWHDTANNQIKLRDQADAAWMPFLFVDETNKLVRPPIPGALFGFTLSNDGVAPTTKLDIAAGFATDDGFAAVISKPSGTLAIDCTLTGAGGLDSGALAASTWYHAFAIAKPDGTSAGFASASLSPTLPTGYLYKRRLGSFRTDASAHILAFTQNGDEFMWSVTAADASGVAVGTTAVLQTLTVPPGLKVNALFHCFISGNGVDLLITSPDENDQSLTGNLRSLSVTNVAGSITASDFNKRTNTSGQIRLRADAASASVSIGTYGWIDTRGRFSA
jgi:hypothetical protein